MKIIELIFQIDDGMSFKECLEKNEGMVCFARLKEHPEYCNSGKNPEEAVDNFFESAKSRNLPTDRSLYQTAVNFEKIEKKKV